MENCTEQTYLAHVWLLTDKISEPVRDWIQYYYDSFETFFINESPTMWSNLLSSMCLTMGCFWLVGSLYTFLDLFQWPNCLYQYKTQDKQVTLEEVIDTAKVSLMNQLTVQAGTSIGFHLLTKVLSFDNNYRVPPVSTIIYHLIVFVFIQETSFYYLHRLLHSGKFYSTIHKIHHRWQAPIAISALYCHPAEHFLANLVPVLLGPIIMGSHRATTAIWLIIVHIVTLNDHSGYHFPLMPSPEFHDYHHLMFNQNFGRMGILDYFHGTSERYFKSKYSKRHQVLLSLTPIKVLVPDDD